MAKKRPHRLAEQKRAERRQRDRERAREATEALLTSEGWQRWVRARAVFHSYSLQNTLLLAHQCAERSITPTCVGGFRAWLKLGRCVRKGEAALWVIAPMPIKQRDGDREETGEEKRIFFRSVPVFELSQTEPLPGVEPEPLEPPSVPIEGDSHASTRAARGPGRRARLRDELRGARRWAWRVLRLPRQADRGRGPLGAQREGPRRRPRALPRARVSRERFGRERAEVIVECAAFVVCSGLGLETGGESVPYLAGWGEDGALEAITEAAELVDEIAARIEQAAGPQSCSVDVELSQITAA